MSVMAASSRGAGWVTDVVAVFSLKIFINVIAIVRMSLPAQPM